MTEGEIAVAMAKYYGLRSLLLVQNSHGITYMESDLLHVTSSLYLEEIEIKVSVSDFRAEFVNPPSSKAYKHQQMHLSGSKVRRYYIAMPQEVYDKVIDIIPDYAGVFIIRHYSDGSSSARKHKTAKDFKHVNQIGMKEMASIATMACSRLWGYKIKGSCGRK